MRLLQITFLNSSSYLLVFECLHADDSSAWFWGGGDIMTPVNNVPGNYSLVNNLRGDSSPVNNVRVDIFIDKILFGW